MHSARVFGLPTWHYLSLLLSGTIKDVSDDSIKRQASTPEQQQEFNEAAERERRVQIWLEGMLAGGPPLSTAVEQWRQGIAIYDPLANNFAEAEEDPNAAKAKPVEDALPEIRRRIRERRELAGKPLHILAEEESERRAAQITDAIKVDRQNGKEATPMHMVLAARYIEGEIDFVAYSQAILDL